MVQFPYPLPLQLQLAHVTEYDVIEGLSFLCGQRALQPDGQEAEQSAGDGQETAHQRDQHRKRRTRVLHPRGRHVKLCRGTGEIRVSVGMEHTIVSKYFFFDPWNTRDENYVVT